MKNIETNIITGYNDMLYESRPVSFSEFISDKYNKIHKELYLDALSKFFDHLINDTITSTFVYDFYRSIENKDNNFDDIWNFIEQLDNKSSIKNAFKILSFDSRSFIKEIYELTCITLDNIKETIINKEIKGIQELSDIRDFRIFYLENYVFLGPENTEEIFDKEFISYKIIHNNETDVNEIIEEKVYASEMFDYVIVLENNIGTRIGYNRNGEWIIIFDKELITKEEFQKMLDSFIYTKETSLNLIKEYKNIALRHYKMMHKIIELKSSEYWMPSSITIISKIRPYRKTIASLKKYWNMIQSYKDISIYDIKNTNENILDAELSNINYITGKATIQSRSTDIEYEVPFKYLSEDVAISEDMTLNNGFITKYNL